MSTFPEIVAGLDLWRLPDVQTHALVEETDDHDPYECVVCWSMSGPTLQDWAVRPAGPAPYTWLGAGRPSVAR